MLFFSPVLAKEKVPGDAGRKSGWGGEAIFYSRYISRGIAASECPVFQPSAWVMLNDSLDGCSITTSDAASDDNHASSSEDDRSGFYCLRFNRLDFKEQALFDIFSMLTDIEDAFRSMKSELGLRPVYHQKERRVDGHLLPHNGWEPGEDQIAR